MINFLNRNIEEIKDDLILRITGGFLALAHVVTAYNWLERNAYRLFEAENTQVMCFPFFPSCWDVKIFNSLNFKFIIYFYLILSVITAGLFFANKVKWAYYLLLFVMTLKIAIWFSRYNFMGNYHAMHLVASLVYFFLLQKRNIYPVFVCVFYFSAGMLKLNEEWMSGAALFSNPIFKGKSLIVALSYVVVLELILVWGLILKNNFYRFITLLQLLLFHAYSYLIVGYLYPAIMYCVLSMIWLPYILKKSTEINSVNLSKTNIFWVIIFIVMNILPHLIFTDIAMDGRQRLFSLNMLDAKLECHGFLLLKKQNSIESLVFPRITSSIRTHCDPVSYQSLIDRLCKDVKKDEILQIFLSSKRSTSTKYEVVWNNKNACSN